MELKVSENLKNMLLEIDEIARSSIYEIYCSRFFQAGLLFSFALAPVRFHISTNPPTKIIGGGLVMGL